MLMSVFAASLGSASTARPAASPAVTLMLTGEAVETVEIAADLLIGDGSAAEASATVSESAAALGLLPARDVFARDPDTPLLLLEPFGKAFRHVWEVPMRAPGVGRRIAVVDGASGAVLKVEDRTPWSECAPQSNTRVYAKAEPQHQSLSDRWIWASPSNDRGASYTHEGHRSATTGIPDIEVFQGEEDGCDPDDAQYIVVPLKTISSTVWYDDWSSPDMFMGRAAGDAVHTTYQTMATLNSLGWQSYNGYGSDAKIVVNATCGANDNATFSESGETYVPANAVAVCPANQRPYIFSAALDVIAHEWGHGVIFSSADWTYSGWGKSYHEGFADVIGYLTEWDQQPSGSGAEKAEWTYAEDNGGAARRVDVDDGAPDGEDGGLSFHAGDTPGGTPGTTLYYYNAANRLPVAFRLLAVGGTNPVCSRVPALPGCGTSVTGQGITDASEVFFRILTSYATSSTDWDDFANLAKLAAFDLYAECSTPCYHATSEQQAAMQSFTAIGYPPGSTSTFQCKPMKCL